MKMKNELLFLFLLSGFCLLVLSFFDVIFDKGWMLVLLPLLLIVTVFTFLTVFFFFKEETDIKETIQEFEKTLKGGLFHFKCPSCDGIFAIKKSKKNNKKPVTLKCPDCGKIGVIPPFPVKIEEEIPEKKSLKANFTCIKCGEGITIWAEGTELYKDVRVYSCPFCGEKKPLERV